MAELTSGELADRFGAFEESRLARFIVNARRRRADELRSLLADPESVTLDVFNREAWRLDGGTTLDGQEIGQNVWSASEVDPALFEELENALEQGRLEMHGNTMWGSATRVYGAPLRVADEQKLANVRRAVAVLNGEESPIDKANAVQAIPGFGRNSATGLTMVFHPNEFCTYNSVSQRVLEAAGYPASTLEDFEQSASALRDELGAEDLLELDYFLYLTSLDLSRTEETSDDVMDAEGALHLVVKWAAGRREDTVERHREVADERGAVWWGLVNTGDPGYRISQQRVDEIRAQIASDTPTYVFISGTKGVEECWQTDLLAVEYEEPASERDLIPSYYGASGTHHLWVKLANFQPRDRDWLFRTLDPDRPVSRGKQLALGNQTNPLFVRMRVGPRVWWVNQGESYSRARAGGYLWAPLLDKIGNPKDHWRTMRHLRVGDIVLNYANTKLRARSVVTGEASASQRPDPEADQAWEDEGLRVEVQYRELTDQIPLDSIPNEWRRDEGGPFTKDGSVKQGYLFPVSDNFASKLGATFPELQIGDGLAEVPIPRPQPLDLEQIGSAVRAEGLDIDDATLRRYHLSLNTRRGFVILAGVSGTGKTWLAEAYARAAGARVLVVPVAPNWTTNEDLLGYRNPLDQQYYDTDFSRFLRDAATEYAEHPDGPRRYHVVLDEMNLARVEYYFAKFLSAMEQRARDDDARIELAPEDTVALPSNLYVTGTVNVDETTHSFADKVYDRAQLIELPVSRAYLEQQLQGQPYREVLLALWDELHVVAPFAYRVVDEINEYVAHAEEMGVDWNAALDEQLLQKVLPKIKGTDLRVRGALERFIQVAADRFPLSTAKAELMLAAFTEHGFTSYF